MPKSFLDTQTYLAGRHLLLTKCRLLAVINLHKDTFQPHTGTRTCVLLARKLRSDEVLGADYPIFMGISRKVGQDSQGVPILKTDAEGRVTDEPDADLTEIAHDYWLHEAGRLVESENRFVIRRSDIGETLQINPQAFLPSLNRTIRDISSVDELQGWSAVSLGQLHPDIRIWKCSRLRSENMIVDLSTNGSSEPYYTPSALLQERGDSVKWLDLSRGSRDQLRQIETIRAKRGDILITRSGTIGRVIFVTAEYDRAIVSDDFVRIRIPDGTLRYYLLAFLESQFALDQMLRNEYGAIQQHLEPVHVRDMVVPVPDSLRLVEPIARKARAVVAAKEELWKAQKVLQSKTKASIQRIITAARHEAS